MVGIAAMIGGSIFILVGPAMGEAGPALLIVFVFLLQFLIFLGLLHLLHLGQQVVDGRIVGHEADLELRRILDQLLQALRERASRR